MKLMKIFSLVAFLAPAYGAVIGPLSITGSVDVTSSVIDWANPFTLLPPLGGTFAGIVGSTGNATDLSIPGTVPPIANFLSGFSALPNVHFDLVTFVPTVAPLCTGAEALGQTCLLPSALGAGPFSAVMVPVGTGTGVNIGTQVFGYFNDTPNTFDNGIGVAYNGVYSTQITNVTISQILATLAGGTGLPTGASPTVPNGTIRATYSANYDAALVINPQTPVPEPATYAMLGFGLIGVWATSRRKASK